MKKIIKFVIGAVIVVVAVVVLAVLTLPLWLGPVVKPVANAAVPKLTKTSFNLGVLSLNPYTGRFEIGDLQLGNPEGYDEKQALALKRLVVDVDMGTLSDEYMHVSEVAIDGVFASYVMANGVNNFDQIQYNVAGGKEKYKAAQAQAQAKAEADKAKKQAQPKADGEQTAEMPKVIIDKLTISDIKLKYGPITLPVPSITLTDIGKKSNGVTLAELGDQIVQAIIKAATAMGDGVKLLGDMAGEGAKTVAEEAVKTIDAVNEGTGKAVEVVGDGAKKVGEGAGKAVDAVGEGAKKVGEGAGKAVDAVGEGAKKVGEGAGKAVDAVGEGAKKAADALKSLF